MAKARQSELSLGLAQQGALWEDHSSNENPDYLTRQLITYIGNKRNLIGHIAKAVERVKNRLGKDRLNVVDAFSGSGVVSRYFKGHSSLLISNDFEEYAAVIGRCFLSNRSAVDLVTLTEVVNELNSEVLTTPFPTGFIEELYSPQDEANISRDDRVFYTKENARRLDNYRRLLTSAPVEMRDLLLGPLLSKASIHANTAGVFKGYYKDRMTGIGRFGGSGADALTRIKGQIKMEVPVLSRFECDYEVSQEDANDLVKRLKGIDLAYIDPPYNQHPYGSNYFMLNLLVRYERPSQMSRVSGIPKDWQRSGYNVRSESLPLLTSLLKNLDTKYLLVSFNDEGFISPGQMMQMLSRIGSVETFETRHNAFRGSRSFENRSIHVTEHLFLVERR